MSDNLTPNVLLVGSGPIACEYAKVLLSLDVPFTVVGRGSRSAEQFYKKTTIQPVIGGLEKFLQDNTSFFSAAIVAVNIDNLAVCAKLLLSAGIKTILIEKPGALTIREIREVIALKSTRCAEVYVAYNRRFFASTRKVKDIISSDGGVTSFAFEFTEWSHVIEKIPAPDAVKHKWFVANSSHVADLGFYLGGFPQKICSHHSGSMPWHPASAVFSGCGISASGAIFSYQANWNAPGRWGVEVSTRNFRLILRPLEKLYVQKKGELISEMVQIDDGLDQEFKPGFFLQVKEFLSSRHENLVTVDEQLEHLQIYYKMAGYNTD